MTQQDRYFKGGSILFLCSGNYFRSRFSEELFNHGAEQLSLPWRAESRGLVADLVIALKETEHRPMMEQRFPELVVKVEFWQVDDIDVVAPDEGLRQAEQYLLARLPRLR